MNQNYLSAAERRALLVLDAYGSRPESWPIQERQAMLACIDRSAALQSYQSQIEWLDLRIRDEQSDSLPSAAVVQALQQRILNALPKPPREAIKDRRKSLWVRIAGWFSRPQLAVVLAGIVLTVVTILLYLPHTTHINTQTKNDYAKWAWYDITGRQLSANKTPASISMSEFIGLESSQNGG